jgi:hypothetical protein
MVVPRGDPPRGPEDLAPRPEELDLFARIEGLVGEEDALLRIPEDERSPEQHARLGEIGRDLDGIFEMLRERADRLAAAKSR